MGDRLDVDALAARDAGLTGIWLDRHNSTKTSCDVDMLRIRSLTELADAVEQGRAIMRSR